MQKFNTLQRSLLQISAHKMSLVKCVAGKESKNNGRPLSAEENDFKKARFVFCFVCISI